MMVEEFRKPRDAEVVRDRALEHISPLFSNPVQAKEHLRRLPISSSSAAHSGWSWVKVPAWAHWVLPEKYGALFVPSFAESSGYEDYPWWDAIDSFISLDQERSREENLRPIHSYSTALGARGSPAFEFAWVNRIAAFLKAWSSNRVGKTVDELFGPLPCPKVTLTHDLDAVEMTVRLKLKQALSRVLEGELIAAIRILSARREEPFLETLLELERKLGVRSVWLIYADPPKWSCHKRHFLDPQYSLDHPRLKWLISQLSEASHPVGLHSSFGSWNDKDRLAREKKRLQKVLGHELADIRQHWLRFGVTITWSLQREVGFGRDFTLGFNDRAGFRASTALPLDLGAGKIIAVPTTLMDSQLFSRSLRGWASRTALIDQLMDEVEGFGGHIAINWHPHTLGSAYGWLDTYEYLLSAIQARGLEVVV